MRKFNLKDVAANRMKNPETEIPLTEAEQQKETERLAGEADQGNLKGFRIAWRTDVGRVRKSNQDAVILGNGMAGVADGMGGHNGGEIASGGLRDGMLRETKGREPDRQALEEAVKKMNLELWEQQEHDAALTGMGTTLTLLWPTEREILIAQIGDSRAYLLRGGEMRQVTADHSLVGDMVRRGVLTEEQAACHPMRNYITRAVGTEDTIEVDLYSEGREKGDRWLVCSDGLYGMMSRSQLQELASLESEEEAADRLLQTALDNGGKDNITLILMTDETGDTPENAAQSDPGEKPVPDAETTEKGGEEA
jgi:protein phosphatase